jgi:hypothetical protein
MFDNIKCDFQSKESITLPFWQGYASSDTRRVSSWF